MSSVRNRNVQQDKTNIFDDQTSFLKNLRMNNGELVINPENYDKGILLDLIDYVKNPVFLDEDEGGTGERDVETILRTIVTRIDRPGDISFELASFDSQKQDYLFFVEKLKNKVEWTKSDIKCRNCGQYTVNFYEKQTRSADESATVFYNCEQCGKKWRSG